MEFRTIDGDELLASCDIEVAVTSKEDVAKAAFLEAAKSYEPDEESVYTYSFNGTDLDIGFDFSSYDLTGYGDAGKIIEDVQNAASEFLKAVFDEGNGNASKIVIYMNDGKEGIGLTPGYKDEDIITLAAAVFGTTEGEELFGKVQTFVLMAEDGDSVVTADFTMTVTIGEGDDGVTFTLEGLKATFTNITKVEAEEE